MYYILNQTKQIIAADNVLLSYLNLNSLEDLTKKIILNELRVVVSTDTQVEIYTKKKVLHFTSKVISLESMFGNFSLVHIVPIEVSNTSSKNDSVITDIVQEDEDLSELVLSKTTNTSIDEISLDTLSTEHIDSESTLIEEGNFINLDSTSIDILDESEDLPIESTKIDENFIKQEEGILKDSENLEDIRENNETIPKEDSSIESDSSIALHSEPITINTLDISSQIGISTEDYNIFFNEYIDTALSLESDLRNSDTIIRNQAIDTLSHLGEILHLSEITPILSKLSAQSSQERTKTIGRYYNLLSRFTPKIDSIPIQADSKELTDDTHQEIHNFGQIKLEDVEPISFDFHLSKVADDLSLPVELVKEFMHDFIDQAHSETKKMLHAYKENNLESIQQIAHLLKDASSNLNITDLSNALHDIQFCEDLVKMEQLIRQYWGQFLSFEQQINTK